MVTILGTEKLDTCPLYLVFTHPAAFNRLLRVYRYAEKGMLPEPGTLEDQAAPLVSALSYIGQGADEVQTALMKQNQKPGRADTSADAE